jgi:predicted  nucleic acid-binding Zn-ribbon protein
VNDSLLQHKKLLKQSKAELDKSSQRISAMKVEIDNLKASGSSIGELNTLDQSVNGSNNYLYLWGALLLLVAVLAYAILRMRSAVKEANYRTALYDQLFEELRENRSKANEREKKLARELQTVRNRIEELTGK